MDAATIASTVTGAISTANLGPTFLTVAGVGIGLGLTIFGVKKAYRVFKGTI